MLGGRVRSVPSIKNSQDRYTFHPLPGSETIVVSTVILAPVVMA